MSKTKALKQLFLIPVLCAASACSGAGDATSGEGAIAEETSAITVHEENLIDGAKLSVVSLDGQLAIHVMLPKAISEALSARVKASAEASDFEGRYVAWTGGNALPAKLQELVAAAPEAGEAAPALEQQSPELHSSAPRPLDSSTDLGSGLGKTQQAVIDFDADAQKFLVDSCEINSKQHVQIPQLIVGGGTIQWLTRYHRMAQEAVVGNSQFRITRDGVLFSFGSVPEGSTSVWDFYTDETPHDVKLEGSGPVMHQCMLGGWEEVRDVRIAKQQLGVVNVKATGVAFKPSSFASLSFVHPTQGEIPLPGGAVKVRSTSSVFFDTLPGCSEFRITRNAKYKISTLLVRGNDGRVSTATTDQIQSQCWDRLSP